MRVSSMFLVGIGLALQAQANPLSDRSTRTFRELTPGGVVAADILVAYEDPNAVGGYNSLNPTNKVDVKVDLPAIMTNASQELSNATNHVVQLGKVTILPTSPKADPDILIVNDCPSGLIRPDDQIAGLSKVCADANTGGYLGVAWWEQTALLTGTTSEEIFATTSGGVNVLKRGSHITVTWQTLKDYGAAALVHEFGHYLFAMRDEYEVVSFLQGTPLNANYLKADIQNPSSAQGGLGGVALAGGLQPASIVDYTDYFKGFAMGFVSDYVANKRGYTPSVVVPVTSGALPTEGATTIVGNKKVYWVPEQFATAVTRGNGDVNPITGRHGGMWSLETSIRTALNKSYSLPTGLAYSAAATQIDPYYVGQGNIFVYDRSGSMYDYIYDGMYAGRYKYEVAQDFFGRMTHTEDPASPIKYSNSAKFGMVAFDDQQVEPVGLEYGRPITDLAKATAAITGKDPLFWGQSTAVGAPQLPLPGNTTDIVSALKLAQKRLDDDLDRPFMRNIILTSDGLHNTGPVDFTGDEGKLGGYRVFSVTIGTMPSDLYATRMQKLATQSSGPDGVPGQAFFTSADVGQNPNDGNLELASIAAKICAAMNNAETIDYGVSNLFRDAAQDFSITTDATQTSVTMSIAYSGSVPPVLSLITSGGQSVTESGIAGITFSQQTNFKTFTVDLTKFPAGTWKLHATTQSATPVTIYASASVKSSKLQINPILDTRFSSSAGDIPVAVVIQDGRPVVGLNVVANLKNVGTGVVRSVTLTWNGSAYVGKFTSTLQPGVSKIDFVVTHPNNGNVTLLGGENTPKTALPQYPYFQPRTVSRDIFVDGKANTKSDLALEAWTIQDQPSFAQGTALRLFLKNNTTVPWTGLKARYFFSVSEIPGGVPGVNINYLAGGSKVKTGIVPGRPGLAYVEFDFAGQTLQPNAVTSNGQNGGEGLYVIEASWRTPWNPLNDYSFQGLKTTWGVNSYVNIYDATGKLLVGNPDMDQTSFVNNSQPIVTLLVPDLMVEGASAKFSANAVDPDGDALLYTWILDGVVVVSNSTSSEVSPSLTAGTHSLSVVVDDQKSTKVTVTKTIQVQAAAGACTVDNSIALDKASTPKSVTLVAGANCFKVLGANMSREWNWKNVVFQANSTGTTLAGVSVQSLPVGTTTNLAGYSQTVNYADPGRDKNLYLKLVSNASKPVSLNWWLQ